MPHGEGNPPGYPQARLRRVAGGSSTRTPAVPVKSGLGFNRADARGAEPSITVGLLHRAPRVPLYPFPSSPLTPIAFSTGRSRVRSVAPDIHSPAFRILPSVRLPPRAGRIE